jgi:hypothetical protein
LDDYFASKGVQLGPTRASIPSHPIYLPIPSPIPSHPSKPFRPLTNVALKSGNWPTKLLLHYGGRESLSLGPEAPVGVYV